MNLKLIRLRARTMQVQQPGLAILFALTGPVDHSC